MRLKYFVGKLSETCFENTCIIFKSIICNAILALNFAVNLLGFNPTTL